MRAFDAAGGEAHRYFLPFNDMMAIAAMRYLVLHGIRVPEDMEIMGFDDNPVASFVLPSLSTVVAAQLPAWGKCGQAAAGKTEGQYRE